MKYFQCKQPYDRNAGFTLIEVMVSVSIFAIISTIGVGSLLSVNNAYKKSRSQRAAIDSLNFIVDSIARDIRTGTAYNCDSGGSPATGYDCYTPSGSPWFEFIDQDGHLVRYERLSSGGLGFIRRTVDGSSENLTNTGVIDVNSMLFRMRGSKKMSNDAQQPFVIISIAGTTNEASDETNIFLQTSVTQRLLDIPSG